MPLAFPASMRRAPPPSSCSAPARRLRRRRRRLRATSRRRRSSAEQGTPVLGQSGDEEPAGPALGFPVFATKNTTRVGGADPVADAAARRAGGLPVALGGHAARTRSCSSTRTTGGRASPPRSSPRRRCARPCCSRRATSCRRRRADALDKLQPTGAQARPASAQVIRIGDVAEPDDLEGDRHPARATRPPPRAAIDKLQSGRRAQAQRGGRGRLGRPARLRDARRRLGGQVRRPGAVDGPRRAPAGDQGGDQGPRASRRSTCSAPRT